MPSTAVLKIIYGQVVGRSNRYSKRSYSISSIIDHRLWSLLLSPFNNSPCLQAFPLRSCFVVHVIIGYFQVYWVPTIWFDTDLFTRKPRNDSAIPSKSDGLICYTNIDKRREIWYQIVQILILNVVCLRLGSSMSDENSWISCSHFSFTNHDLYNKHRQSTAASARFVPPNMSLIMVKAFNCMSMHS